jgi:hypothetical protein
MNPDEKHLLLKTLELAEENNKMIRKLVRMYRLTRAIRVVYWIIIIGITLGAFYFVQPYVEGAKTVYTTVTGDVGNLKAIRDNFINKKAPTPTPVR